MSVNYCTYYNIEIKTERNIAQNQAASDLDETVIANESASAQCIEQEPWLMQPRLSYTLQSIDVKLQVLATVKCYKHSKMTRLYTLHSS